MSALLTPWFSNILNGVHRQNPDPRQVTVRHRGRIGIPMEGVSPGENRFPVVDGMDSGGVG